MKLTFTTADFDEPTWIAFAKSIGWQQQVMTTDQSPNYLMDNPVKYSDYIIAVYAQPIYRDLANFNVAEIKSQVYAQISIANQTLENAKATAEQDVKTLVTATIQ